MKRIFGNHIILLIALIFLISGCIDIEEKVQINPNGSGTLSINVIVDPMLAEELKKQRFLDIPGKQVLIKNIIRGEKFYHIESTHFRSLGELKMVDEIISIAVTKKGFMGLGENEAIFEHFMNFSESSKEDAALMVGHYFNYTVELPGRIKKAYPAILNEIEVEPEIKENRVVWNIPLDLFIKSGRAFFRAAFKGKFNFPSDIQSTKVAVVNKGTLKVEKKKIKPKVKKQKAKTKEFISILPSQLYSHLAKYLGKRQKKEWEKYRGKIIRWKAKLPPRYFSPYHITEEGLRVKLISDGHWIRAYFPESDASKFDKLSEYDTIVFEGTLDDFGTWEYSFLVKECKLIKIIKAKPPSISILGCKFSYRNTYTTAVEITACTISLANKGGLPAEVHTVEVTIGNIKGIKRNQIIPPNGKVEAPIFSPVGGEWYQDGKRLRLSEFPVLPRNVNNVMVKIKDDHGKVITSKKFNCSFPAGYNESRCVAVN